MSLCLQDETPAAGCGRLWIAGWQSVHYES
jgi:hypothetical protein